MKLLEGIRVLDISTVIAAPFAAGLMADFGAEVIKVEMPDGGDPFRRLGRISLKGRLCVLPVWAEIKNQLL